MDLTMARGNLLVAGMLITLSLPTAAEVPGPAVELITSGNEIVLTVAGATRREVLTRILGRSGVAVEWLDPAFADESINARYQGSMDKVIIAVLDRANFLITY